MDETFIGGFSIGRAPSPAPPALPPKDDMYNRPGYHIGSRIHPSISSSQLTSMSAVERSKTLRIARMEPHLQVCVLSRLERRVLTILYQFMVGPLLK